ncbi:WXG100 family type VII secretion target [Saccharopolyspora sp. 5N708]|uniref:WXG100 family type VII secretion target n=1 Tax=Saccharopolyspora sp. 5N708 TaxID=3457424 RepID=UPI003FD0237A
MTGFDVNPEALRGASPQFDGAADKLKAAMDKLNGVLQAEGKCWGGDDAGQEFAKDYEPGSQQAVDAFSGLTNSLHQIRGELDNTANTWATDDTNNADSFR